MKPKDAVRSFDGRIIGYIEVTSDRGDKTVRDAVGHILGRYDAGCNVTRDFVGRIVARGDQCSLLLSLEK